MRRFAIAFCLVIGLVSTSVGGDKSAPITIEYHGQSFYIITTSKGKRIAFDPHTIPAYYPTGLIPVKTKEQNADIICISHNHNDHIRTEVFEKTKTQKILRGLKNESLKADWALINESFFDGDVKIRNVPTWHDNMEGFERGKNSVFIVEVDGWRVCHLGDLGHQLDLKLLKRIGPVDVLMIPVGGAYTLNGAEAKKVVAQIKPKEYIFPMHYGTKIFTDILPIDEFLDEVEARRIVRLGETIEDPTKRENKIELNRDKNRPRPLIVQLHYWEKEKKDEKKKDEKKKDEKKKDEKK